jgi:anti-sigma factor RsiW
MNDHDEIRELLTLAAADALASGEEERVARHIQSCASCARELEDWQLLAGGLRRLPTPQPSAGVVERARARAEIRLAEEAEYRWHRGVMIFLILFAWALTLVSWPLVRLFTGGLLGLLDMRVTHAWIGFAGFTTAAWLAGGAAAVLLSFHYRRERRVA